MTHTITTKAPDGTTTTFECADDQYILDAAEEAGVDITTLVVLVLVHLVLVNLRVALSIKAINRSWMMTKSKQVSCSLVSLILLAIV